MTEYASMARREQQLTDLGYRLAFCRSCNRQSAWHRPSGECANADRHLRSCDECGRPTTGPTCSECSERAS